MRYCAPTLLSYRCALRALLEALPYAIAENNPWAGMGTVIRCDSKDEVTSGSYIGWACMQRNLSW